MGIPSVDLNDFLSGDENKKMEFVKALGEAYEGIGFVAVKNHLMDEASTAELYNAVQSFFNLDQESKEKYEIPELAGQRGYVSFGKEHAKDSKAGDLKEFWHFGQTVEDDDPIGKEYPLNFHVSELPEYNNIGVRSYKN